MNLMEDKTIRRAFGAYIRAGRKRANMTQAEVATELDITQSVYCCYETGRRPVSLSMAINICKLLELDINEFMQMITRTKPRLQRTIAEK